MSFKMIMLDVNEAGILLETLTDKLEDLVSMKKTLEQQKTGAPEVMAAVREDIELIISIGEKVDDVAKQFIEEEKNKSN